jgi:hypothetical protein
MDRRSVWLWYVVGWGAWLLSAVPATAGDWLALGSGGAHWTDNASLPVCKQLAELKHDSSLASVNFTPDGDWIILSGGNGFYTNNMGLPACKKLAELQKKNVDFKSAAFAPNGGWILFWGKNSFWSIGGIPSPAFDKAGEVSKAGEKLRSIAFSPDGGWVLLCGEAGAYYQNIPAELAKIINQAVKNQDPIRCVHFTSTGDWFVLSDGGWWTSDVNLPAAKELAKLIKAGSSPRWLATTPDDPATLRYRLEIKPAQRVRAVLSIDYAKPDAKVDAWYLYAAEAPDLPSQRDVHTTLSPPGKVVEEASPYHRRVILSKVEGRPEVRAALTIEATLMSRHLRPLPAGRTGPEVKDLSPEQVQEYTRATPWADYDAPRFREWLEKGSLHRQKGETDMAFAHRAFKYLKHHFTYQWPTPSDSAAKVCATGKSDCGGLSSVFVATMRANGVPARLLGGRWAQSQQKKDYGQWHVKSEFFAKGVGWVPVDSSGAVTDTAGSEFAYFGNDEGDHIAFARDQDYIVNSFVSGQQHVAIFQGVTYWWRGSGNDKNSREDEHWTVTKEKLP